jgi:putative flavoprotein involved in K+ transport
MHTEFVETIIVGGGQAGLAMSWHLGRLGREHIILERGRVAERWKSERWDSLHFQAPNWNLRLPGFTNRATDPDAFAPCDEVVGYLEGYAAAIRAPLRCGVAATHLRQKEGSGRLVIESTAGSFEAKHVVIATGPFQTPVASPLTSQKALSLHSSQYRNPEQLPPGAVLVVGSGNSGCQIAEELCTSGRSVFLSVSAHQRTPRRYRGKDCIWWNLALGDADRTVAQRIGAQPSRLMTGVAGGHDIDPRRLAAQGVVLLGRVLGAENGRLTFAPDLGENLARGDVSLVELMRRCDEYVVRNGLDFPAREATAEPQDPVEVANPVRALDIASSGISTIIWANGFRYDHGWIDVPVFGECGEQSHRVPNHTRGITSVPGVYFLGLPWLHKWKSAFLFGVGEDAEHIVTHIARRFPADRSFISAGTCTP